MIHKLESSRSICCFYYNGPCGDSNDSGGPCVSSIRPPGYFLKDEAFFACSYKPKGIHLPISCLL